MTVLAQVFQTDKPDVQVCPVRKRVPVSSIRKFTSTETAEHHAQDGGGELSGRHAARRTFSSTYLLSFAGSCDASMDDMDASAPRPYESPPFLAFLDRIELPLSQQEALPRLPAFPFGKDERDHTVFQRPTGIAGPDGFAPPVIEVRRVPTEREPHPVLLQLHLQVLGTASFGCIDVHVDVVHGLFPRVGYLSCTIRTWTISTSPSGPTVAFYGSPDVPPTSTTCLSRSLGATRSAIDAARRSKWRPSARAPGTSTTHAPRLTLVLTDRGGSGPPGSGCCPNRLFPVGFGSTHERTNHQTPGSKFDCTCVPTVPVAVLFRSSRRLTSPTQQQASTLFSLPVPSDTPLECIRWGAVLPSHALQATYHCSLL
eukprot:scaffold172_cov341-Pavlova_lutheri.AAC.26